MDSFIHPNRILSSDSIWVKILVVVIFVADSFNTVFDMVYLYDTLILNYGILSFGFLHLSVPLFSPF